jgi:hypothetical protein
MMRIRSKLRHTALYAAGLSVFFLLLMTACGGGNGDDESPAPAATAAPATAAPATQPPTGTPAAAAETTPDAPQQGAPSSGSETLFITANETGTITVELNAGDILELSFDVESSITGGQNVSAGIGQATQGIKLVINDPLAEPLVTIDDTTDSDTVSVEAEISGEHLIFFFNPFPLQAVNVEASWEVNP